MNAAARRQAPQEQLLTADDVHRRLPLVRAIVADLVALHRDLSDRRERLARIRRLPGGKRQEGSLYSEELEQIEQDLARDDQMLDGYVAELESLGGTVRDADAGRIEFAGRLEGKPVFFGWRQGSDDLSYWRSADSDNSEQHPLLEGSVPQDDAP
jgi:hypothetical protein